MPEQHGTRVTTARPARPGRAWRGQSPVERREARRRRLHAAALELMGTKGYAATSLTALCARGSVSPRHFYELYPDRERLLRALYDELVGDVAGAIVEALDGAPLDAASRVAAGIETVVRWCGEDPRRARIVQLEAVGVSPAMEVHRRAAMRAFAALVTRQYNQLVEAGGAPPRPFDLVAIGLVGAVNELVSDWLLTEPRPPAEKLLPPLLHIVRTSFTG